MKCARNPWLRLGWQSWALGMEASSVVALRMMKLAAGGAAAEAEAARMVAEKSKAALELQAMLWTGALGVTGPSVAAKTIQHYRRKVGANRRRLVRR
jgi:hypothetical protein